MSRRVGPVALAVAALALVPGAAQARHGGDDGGGGGDSRVRAEARCGQAARTRMDARSRDGAVRLDWRLERGRARERWRIVVVQESRVVWRGTRSISGSGRIALRLSLRDLPGADRIEVRASGPRGTSCGVAGTLRG